jgi:hypothetical protein
MSAILVLIMIASGCSKKPVQANPGFAEVALDVNVFDGLSRVPEFYLNRTGYSFKKDKIATDDLYAIKSGADQSIIATGEGIKILYWHIAGRWDIHGPELLVRSQRPNMANSLVL